MTLFLLTFFLLYGSFHVYVFLKARAAFAFDAMTGIAVALFMLLMIFAPILVRLSEKAHFESLARVISYIGYTWLGVIFLFVSASIVVDVYRSVVYLAGLILDTDLANLTVSAKYAFFIPLLFSSIAVVYGYFEARDIRTETISIKSPKISAEVGRVRIVQISDVHLGLIVRGERLGRILREVKRANPDILVSTGDLVDGQINGLSGLADMLKEVTPRYGKFAITGNHEFYAGLSQSLDFTSTAGFRMLRGDGITVDGVINIAGVDDPQARGFGIVPSHSEQEALSVSSNGRFTVLLKHRPVIDKRSIGLFDLQLSGHVHKGQIFPFSVVTGLYYHPIQAGFAELSGHSYLYVSRGSGTWGPPIRFLAPPEVSVIDIIHSD